jgi:hypothetical protein
VGSFLGVNNNELLPIEGKVYLENGEARVEWASHKPVAARKTFSEAMLDIYRHLQRRHLAPQHHQKGLVELGFGKVVDQQITSYLNDEETL